MGLSGSRPVPHDLGCVSGHIQLDNPQAPRPKHESGTPSDDILLLGLSMMAASACVRLEVIAVFSKSSCGMAHRILKSVTHQIHRSDRVAM